MENTKQENTPKFAVMAQYLKDMSFECPNGIAGIDESKMMMDVNIGLATKTIDKNIIEVTLSLKAESKAEDKPIFLADVSYAGQFIMQNIPAEQQEMLVGIEAPSLLFPFARRILMTAVTDAGLRTPQLEPINFAHLFMQNKKRQQQEQQNKQAN